MDNKEIFNAVSDNYDNLLQDNLGVFGKDIHYYNVYKAQLLKSRLSSPPSSILEFGCGIGNNIRALNRFFTSCNVVGFDISEDSLDIAKANNPDNTFYGQIEQLENQSFDVIFVSGVLHHIALADRDDIMQQIKSLLTVDGQVIIFEHNPFNPITQRLVSTCPFDEGVTLLKPKEVRSLARSADLALVEQKSCLFFPAAFKKLLPLEKLFFWLRIPLGGQHYTILQNKPAVSRN